MMILLCHTLRHKVLARQHSRGDREVRSTLLDLYLSMKRCVRHRSERSVRNENIGEA